MAAPPSSAGRVGSHTKANVTSSSSSGGSGSNSFRLQVDELGAESRLGSTHALSVRWYTSIKDIKDLLHKKIGVPPRQLELFYGISKLSNHLTLHDLGIEESGSTLRLSHAFSGLTQQHMGSSNYSSGSSGGGYVLGPPAHSKLVLPEECSILLDEVSKGFKRGHKPIGTDPLDCTGGVYFLTDGEKRKCAVFKPFDEEQGMNHNSKGYEGNGDMSAGLRPNFLPGQGCMREVAAYVLDKDGFAGVPETLLVDCCDKAFSYPASYPGSGTQTQPVPKLGSLQRFIYFQHTFDDIGTSCFSDFEVQKIALLDMRLLNSDRNASNILVLNKDANFSENARHHNYGSRYDRSSSICSSEDWRSGGSDYLDFSDGEVDGGAAVVRARAASTGGYSSVEDIVSGSPRGQRQARALKARKEQYILVPIDHGYVMPLSLQINEYDWVWFNMPQVRRPVDPEIKEYILNLDFDEIVRKLPAHRVAVPQECLFLMKLSHELLVNGIKAGLTLYDIAKLIARVEEDVPSPLERAIVVAGENAHRAIEMRSGRLDSRSIPFPQSPTGRLGTGGFAQSLLKTRTGSSATLATEAERLVPSPSSSLQTATFTPPRGAGLVLRSAGSSGHLDSQHHASQSSAKRIETEGGGWKPPQCSTTDAGEATADSGDTSGCDSKSKFEGDSSSSSPDREKDRESPDLHSHSLDELLNGSDLSANSNPNSPTGGLGAHSFLANPLNGKALHSLKSVDTWSVSGRDCRLQTSPCITASPAAAAGSPRCRPIKTESDAALPILSVFPRMDNVDHQSSPSAQRGTPGLQHQLRRGSSDGSTRRRSKMLGSSEQLADRYDADAEAESENVSSLNLNGDAKKANLNLSTNSASNSSYYGEGDCTDSSDDDDVPEKPSHQPVASRSKSISDKHSMPAFMRVASFSSFASEPIYDAEVNERRFQKLSREKRRQNLSLPEFHQLRERFASQRLSVLLSKAK